MSATVKNNFQEYDPRHRLTGAVVLILLAIILLPMLLSKKPDEQPAETDPVVMEIRKEGKKVFVSRISSTTSTDSTATVPVEKKDEKTGVAENEKTKKSTESGQGSSALFKPMASTSVKKSSDKKSTDKQTTVKKTASKPSSTKSSTAKKSASTKTAPKKSTAAAAAGGWILQVGVFSQSANASKKVSELKKKGFNAKSSKIKTKKGMVTKVWIGPFKDRASAESMQDRLQHKTRQRGMVVKNKPN